MTTPAPDLATVRDPVKLYEWLGRLVAAVNTASASSPPSTVIDLNLIRRELQSNGHFPLSIEGLGGQARDAQTPRTLTGTSLPKPELYPAGSQFVLQSGSTFKRYYRSATIPVRWIEEAAATPANMVTTDTVQTIGPAAAKAFADLLTASAGVSVGGSTTLHGAKEDIVFSAEQITLNTGGTTTDSATNMIPGNCLIRWVGIFVQVTITTATVVQIGDSTTAARFAQLGTLTAGASQVGLDQWQGSVTTNAAGPVNFSARKLRVTTDVNPGAGRIFAVVCASQVTAPTS